MKKAKTRQLIDKERQDIADHLKTMDLITRVRIMGNAEGNRARFMVESHNSHFPVTRVAGQLKRSYIPSTRSRGFPVKLM